MRGSAVAVEVTLDSGEVLPEVAKHGMRYVIARSGKPFRVKVTALGESTNTTIVRLKVDGVQVGYSKVISGEGSFKESTTFEGFLTKSDVGGTGTMQRFQFADAAQLPIGAQATSLDFDIGKIEVTVERARQGAPKQVTGYGVDVNHAKAPKLGEDKKWFEGPSLHATNGPSSLIPWAWAPYDFIYGPELERVVMRYETAITLVLREILDPSRADHQLIMGPALQLEVERALQRVPLVAPAPRARRSRDRSQAFPTVKLEPGNQQHVARDEYESCDLTDDAAALSWRVHKKPCIELD